MLYVLIPFTGGYLAWGALFMPQWEHRILFTRVIALAGTLLNGEWDPRVAMTISAALYATTFAQFQRAFVGALSWPLPPHPLIAMLVWLPWIANGLLLLRRRSATTLEWLCVGLGTWGFINAVALGYARQYEGPPFDTRFFTPFSIGIMASLGSSVALALRAPRWRWRTPPLLGWSAIACGFIAVGYTGIAVARESRYQRAFSDEAMRHYLATGDRGPLIAKPPNHTGADVAERLDSPLFRRIMPAPSRRIAAARTPGAAPADPGPVTTIARTALGLTLATVAALTFAHPHIWNRELFWDDCTFILLRNWPLVWLDAHPWLRALSGLNLVLMAAALALVFSRQRHARALWLALGIGLLPAFTNSLVEPRYFIPAAGVILLFLDIPAPDQRRLAWWWAALLLLHAPFIARGLSLW